MIGNEIVSTGVTELIQQLSDYKDTVTHNCKIMLEMEKENEDLSKKHVGRLSSPLQLNMRSEQYREWEVEINKRVWRTLVDTVHMERYMLCTEFTKLQGQIEANELPEFTLLNAEAWLDNLKALIFDNVTVMIQEVFQRVTSKTYTTIKSYSAPKKKRNNNGVDSHFILSTGDIGGYHSSPRTPTITDDLEKVIYILAGQKLPNPSIRYRMEKAGTTEGVTPWFRIKCCKNGNTHYWITDPAILLKLNRIGANNTIGGENIKIKIFE